MEAVAESPRAVPDEMKAPANEPNPTHRGWLVGVRRAGALLALAAVVTVVWFFSRYSTKSEEIVPLREIATFDYPDDPAGRSVHHTKYNGRELTLVQRDETHYDFVFEPTEEHVAKVVFKNVDVSLMTPGLPEYPEIDDSLRRIALTDREWNRQQAQFYVGQDDVEVTGGDGWEQENLYVASLAKNCLNACLWEVLLFTKTEGGKEMYYQGWFNFPVGHYKQLWEANTGLSYWEDFNFWRMEHWVDPEGNIMDLAKLREVVAEAEIEAEFNPNEPIWYAGEQVRKRRTALVEGVRTWGDYVERRDDVRFATFLPPGVYQVDAPWENRYELIAQFEGCTHRRVKSRLTGDELDELVLDYKSADGKPVRLVIGGIDLASAPAVPKTAYNKGLYLPMGIGVPPFYQDYSDLQQGPPTESPYYCFVLDDQNSWLDHHSMAIDGPVIHRDPTDPALVHLYLLSYERHQIVAHYQLRAPGIAGEARAPAESVARGATDPRR